MVIFFLVFFLSLADFFPEGSLVVAVFELAGFGIEMLGQLLILSIGP